MRLTLIAFASLLTVACNGEQAVETDPGTDVGTDSGTDAGSDTGTSAPTYMEPAAVGIEFDGGIDVDGNFISYMVQGTEVPPGVILTFADVDYFSATTEEEQAGHFCQAWGSFTAPAATTPIPTADGATLWSSYDGALSIENWDCVDLLDPAVWGTDGEALATAFQGVHLGIGFGPMTTYLEDAWGTDGMDMYGTSLFAEYIAINDADGTWDGNDWTSAMIFEWDTTTHEVSADVDGNLIPIDLTGMQVGATLPEGYVRSFAYWYQDFPLMDLTNLADGAPL